jgi:hypothetical protein
MQLNQWLAPGSQFVWGGDSMTKSQEDIAAWVRLHRVCYELAPLYEMEGGNKVQVGYA